VKKPKKLLYGDKIALAAPASGFNLEAFSKGKKKIEAMGFEVVHRPDIFHRLNYLAGDDNRRLSELEEVLMDKSVKAVICVRGGYGTLRLLHRIRWESFLEKIFVGCSDITPILNLLAVRSGFVSFHGPMLAGEYGISEDEEALKNLFSLLTGKSKTPFSYKSQNLVSLFGGHTQGKLLGGCLTLLVSLLGTAWDFDYSGCIIFIEDIAESPYKIDRMLSQLLLAGKLNKAAGIIFGEMTNCQGDYSLKDIIIERLAPLNIPILYGFPSGHSQASITLPLGLPVVIDADACEILIKECPVV